MGTSKTHHADSSAASSRPYAHTRILSRDAPPDDPFAFLFPNPAPHPVVLDHVGNPVPSSPPSTHRASGDGDINPSIGNMKPLPQSPVRILSPKQQSRLSSSSSGSAASPSHSPNAASSDAGGSGGSLLLSSSSPLAKSARAQTPTAGTQERSRSSSATRDGARPNPLKRTSPPSHSPPRPQAAGNSAAASGSSKRQRLDSDPTDNASSNLSGSRRSNSSNPDLSSSPYLHSSSSPAPEGTPPPPGAPPVTVIDSAQIVQSDIKQYTTWFLDPDMKEPNDPMPTVELVYLTKTYRETFSLLRPKPLVAAMATLSTSSSVSNLLHTTGSSSRGNTPPPAASSSGPSSSKTYVTHHDPNSEYDPVTDLIETIRMLVQYSLICPPASVKSIFSDDSSLTSGSVGTGGIVRRLERARNRRSLADFVAAVADFNREFAKCKREGMVLGYTKRRLNSPATSEETRKAILAKMTEFAPAELVHHVLYQAYTRAVAPHADVLQKYEAFSNTVYGEVNPVFVEMMLDKLKIESKDTFLDLGSGIGNVVLQVAARTECSAYGIEIQSAAADLAQRQLDEFRARLKYLNRRLGHVELYEGDMLTHAAIPGLISRANVIFCNNYVFQPELNRALVELFLDCQDGAKIVSLREFAPVDNRITSRNVHSVEALFDVECFEYHADYVSWTDQAGKWYVHTMNRARVRKWCEANGMPY